jgi:hypothetical protein
MENAGSITVYVERSGGLSEKLSVRYACEEGTAFANGEYTHVEGVLNFDVNVEKLGIKIPIIDNDEPEPDRHFKVVLKGLKMENEDAREVYNVILALPTTEITIVDDDCPGIF